MIHDHRIQNLLEDLIEQKPPIELKQLQLFSLN